MMTTGDRIKLKRTENGLTLEEVARAAGVSRQTVQKYETGLIANIPSDKIEKIAKMLHVTPGYLMGWDEMPKYFLPLGTRRFRLLGNIACGEPIFAAEEKELYIEAGAGIKADFCLKAKGDSMIGARIYDGDIVFIRQQPTVENGEIAAVLIGDEVTLKRVYYDREANLLFLHSENPQYKAMRYSGAALDEIRILGKAVAFQSDVR